MSISKYLDEVRKDPYFLLILFGGIIWYIALLLGIFGYLGITLGFTLTCFATTAYALKRPIELAWPGLLVGVIVHFIGLLILGLIPFIGPAIYVLGHILILFFAVPLAIRRD